MALLLTCLNFKFDDTPKGEFVETIFAAQGQLEHKQNRRHTLQKMKARLEQGFWVFQAPVGYRFQKMSGHGKILVRDEPSTSILQEALEGYASGRFQIQAEVKRFLESFPEFLHNRGGGVHKQRIREYLTHPLYAGYVESRDWGVSLRPGHHEGLINFETFQKIQQRLQTNSHAPARKNLNQDFPLRGFVACGDCGDPLTACWSKDRGSHYPYYLYQNKTCESYGKSIRHDTIKGEFEALLRQIKPTEELIGIAGAMLKKLWDHRRDTQKQRTAGLEAEIAEIAEIAKIDAKIEQLLDRIVDAESDMVVKAYERHIRQMETEKLLMQEKIETSGRPLRSFEQTYRTALEFLASPWKLWASEHLEDKRAVLKLAFSDRLVWVRNKGYRTAETAFPFKALGGFCGDVSCLVPGAGLEPA